MTYWSWTTPSAFWPSSSRRVPLLEERGGRLVALRPALLQLVEVGDRFAVFLLRVVRLADPVLGVVGHVGVGVDIQVLLESLDGERVPSLGVVRVGRVVELPRRRPRSTGDCRVGRRAVVGGRPGRRRRGGGCIRERFPCVCVSAICWESWARRRLVSSSFASSRSICVVSSPSRTPVSALDLSSWVVCCDTLWLRRATSSLLEDLRSSAWISFSISFNRPWRPSMSSDETQPTPPSRDRATATAGAAREPCHGTTWP